MSHVPTVLKSDRSVFDKMLPVDDNAPYSHNRLNFLVAYKINTVSYAAPESFVNGSGFQEPKFY